MIRFAMPRSGCALIAAAGLACPAVGQEVELTARASVATAILDESGAGDIAHLAPLADVFLGAVRTDTLDSGLQLVWRGEVRLQADAPGRRAFAGDGLDCTRRQTGCPSIFGAPTVLPPVSPATGMGRSAAEDEVFAAVDAVSLTVSGAWGEGVVGLDTGAAARLDARAPRVLDAVSVLSPALDPTARSVIRARNDVTGPSFKGSYLSPRWLGLRAGVSYTPEANLEGADFDPRPDTRLAQARLEEVWEGGLSFDRRFRSADLRVRAALTGVIATSGSAAGGFGDYEAWGGGLELERSGWTGGVRYLSSNNAQPTGRGDYEAVEAGLVREAGEWRFGLEAGWARDDLQGVEGRSWMISGRRALGEHFALGLGWAESDVDSSGFTGFYNSRARGLVLEASVRK